MASPNLPTRFPCWVKAVYSWGGETKRDLGFMEGDLIECLNAGDGMWWMGRLRRDRRMVGLFPSNFVKVLDESYEPAPQRPSPLASVTPSRNSSPSSISNSVQATPSPQKNFFRRPFKTHTHGSSPSHASQNGSHTGTPSPPNSVNKTFKPRPFSSMKPPQQSPLAQKPVVSRNPSPTIPAPIPRAGSAFGDADDLEPVRSPSPKPYRSHSRQQSPTSSPLQDAGISSPSSSPPPPPAHRVPCTNGYENDRNYYNQDSHDEQPITPRSTSPSLSGQHSGMTPSPLRDAINDVMTSLEDMGRPREPEAEQGEQTDDDHDIWSPKAFREVYSQSGRNVRPHTSIAVDREYGNADESRDHRDLYYDDGTGGRINSYVERMESRLRALQKEDATHNYFAQGDVASSPPPAPPPKGTPKMSRPSSSMGISRPEPSYDQVQQYPSTLLNHRNLDGNENEPRPSLKTRKSAYELGRERLSRTFTTKSSVTNSSSAQSTSTNNTQSTQLTSQSVMSGHSAGGFSATSAGSLARRKFGRSGSVKGQPTMVIDTQRPKSALNGTLSSYSSEPDNGRSDDSDWAPVESGAVLGGLSTPVAKKRGFLTKMLDSVKTGTASARTNMSSTPLSRPPSRLKSAMPPGISSAGIGKDSNNQGRDAAKEMGLGGSTGDWVQMRRDVNRSNSLSRNERNERIERCQLEDIPVLTPVDVLNETAEGDEAFDGSCVTNPTDFSACNLSMVDKSARFVNNLPAVINSVSLAQGYLCRQYKSEVQRLRAIFIWVSEKVTWEEDYEGGVDTRRVIQSRRGCTQEVAVLAAEMCNGVGIHAEVVRGYLKAPGEDLLSTDLSEAAAHANHWWNAVLVDGEWRIMDCSLASPTNPQRANYTTTTNQAAESWWFLARPLEICYTHVPLLPRDQHIVPPMPHDVLMALPVASTSFFKNQLQLWDYDTSLIHLDGLEMAHIQLSVPDNVECTAEVEARAFIKDPEGDFYESGDVVNKPALAQGEFVSTDGTGGAHSSFKRYTIKALLPSSTDSSSVATLKVYAGKRGLQHSIASNPHNLALSLPLSHKGPNPPYEFFTRHPTPHALRHELYVTGPLCKRLVYNSTFVFGVRQHPASARRGKDAGALPSAISRPGSALSMTSGSASGSNYSQPSTDSSSAASADASARGDLQQEKPAKLAVQSPSGKILRMTRKIDHSMQHRHGGRGGAAEGKASGDDNGGVVKVGSHWETIIKIGERGVWRGLVLADRSARWCVFAEWECA